MSFRGVSLLLVGLVAVHCKPLGEEVATPGTQPAPEDPVPTSQSYQEIVQLLHALQNQDPASPSNQQPVPAPTNNPFPVPPVPTNGPPAQQFSASQLQSANSATQQATAQHSQSSTSIQQSSSSSAQVQSTNSAAQHASNDANVVYQQVPAADLQFPASQQVQQASSAQSTISASSVNAQQSSGQQQAQQSAQGRTWFHPVPVVLGHQVVPQVVVPVANQVADNSAMNAHYKFGFVVDNNIEGNFIQRDEVRANGRVAGVYSYDDGYFLRSVTYVADRNGFRIVKEHVAPSTKRGRLSGNAVVKSYFDNNAYQYGIVRNDLKFKAPQVHAQ